MLLPRVHWDGVADGSITLAFRRMRRPTVRAGGTLRTAVGVLAIDAVDAVEPADITDAEALEVGYRLSPRGETVLRHLGVHAEVSAGSPRPAPRPAP